MDGQFILVYAKNVTKLVSKSKKTNEMTKCKSSAQCDAFEDE